METADGQGQSPSVRHALLKLFGARSAAAIRTGANTMLAAMQKTLWPRRRPLSARRVCIYRIGNIGDTVCAIPALYSIRCAYPNARLTLVSSPGRRGIVGAADLLGGASWLDDLFVYYSDELESVRERLRLLRELRSRRFDVWIELPVVNAGMGTLIRNIAAAQAAGVRWAGGWELGTIEFAAQAQAEIFHYCDEVERLLGLVKRLGIEPFTGAVALPIREQHHRAALALMSNCGVAGRPLIVIAPGAKRAPNRWPAERFAEVGRYLMRAGFCVAVVGGADDDGVCAGVAGGIGCDAFNAAGRLSLLESAALIARSMMVICNDSGVQHLAAAVDTPSLSLFSCRDLPGIWYPHGRANRVIRKRVPCHTCLCQRCPFDNRCINMITADEVISEANRTLWAIQNGGCDSMRSDYVRTAHASRAR